VATVLWSVQGAGVLVSFAVAAANVATIILALRSALAVAPPAE
jgi:hypothetical protein